MKDHQNLSNISIQEPASDSFLHSRRSIATAIYRARSAASHSPSRRKSNEREVKENSIKESIQKKTSSLKEINCFLTIVPSNVWYPRRFPVVFPNGDEKELSLPAGVIPGEIVLVENFEAKKLSSLPVQSNLPYIIPLSDNFSKYISIRGSRKTLTFTTVTSQKIRASLPNGEGKAVQVFKDENEKWTVHLIKEKGKATRRYSEKVKLSPK